MIIIHNAWQWNLIMRINFNSKFSHFPVFRCNKLRLYKHPPILAKLPISVNSFGTCKYCEFLSYAYNIFIISSRIIFRAAIFKLTTKDPEKSEIKCRMDEFKLYQTNMYVVSPSISIFFTWTGQNESWGYYLFKTSHVEDFANALALPPVAEICIHSLHRLSFSLTWHTTFSMQRSRKDFPFIE